VALGPRLPRILAGPSPALAVTSLERFEVKTDGAPAATARGFESLYGTASVTSCTGPAARPSRPSAC
jgi:hypothetical protein